MSSKPAASTVSPKTDASRRAELVQTMEAMNLSADVKKAMQAKLKAAEEAEKAGSKPKKMSVLDFETLTIIGRGAFGEVRVCRKKDDKHGEIYKYVVKYRERETNCNSSGTSYLILC